MTDFRVESDAQLLGPYLDEVATSLPDADRGLDELLAAAATTPQQQRSFPPPFSTWGFQSMFSATKFVAAAAIVALFGGFVLAGVLTQPNESETFVGASASPETTSQPIRLPAQIPDTVESGTLDTPIGPARWVHLSGDESMLPRWFHGLVSTADGYIAPEWDGTVSTMWRSRDLISWSAEPLGIEARYGELTEADGSYWLNTVEPAGLWRSEDTVTWERIDLGALAAPGPDGHRWLLRPSAPVSYDDAVIVPFEWSVDRAVVLRELPGFKPAEPLDFHEVEPGVYEFFNYRTGPFASVRFEDTEGGVRVIDHEGDSDLTVIDGVSLEFIERLHRGEITGVDGLAILDGQALVEVDLADGISQALQTAFAADDSGFASYSIDGDLVYAHRSQDGRDWQLADVIGDDEGEPVGIEYVHSGDRFMTPWPTSGARLESSRGVTWTTTDGVVWEAEDTPPEGFETSFASGWISLPMGGSGDPVSGGLALWFQPENGEPVPIDIAEMAIPVNDGISGPNCGGSEGFISPNTSVTSYDEECDGLREHWIITFDEVPA